MPEKRICVWKSLDLNVDDPSLRTQLQQEGEAISEAFNSVGKEEGVTIWRVTVRQYIYTQGISIFFYLGWIDPCDLVKFHSH